MSYAAEYLGHAVAQPPKPSRKRVIIVRPLDFLAPEEYGVGSLFLEPAAAFYRHLAVTAMPFAHVGQLLSGHGTCVGRELPRPIYIAPPDTRKGPIDSMGRHYQTTPGAILAAELRYRFRHALLGCCHASGWEWRKAVGLLPEDYTKVQRHFIPWRADIRGTDMEKRVDVLGMLATRRFAKSPNQFHRRAVQAHDLALEFTQYGYIARLYYGYPKESSSWSVDSYSVPSETFAEFIERATTELSAALVATEHPKGREKLAQEEIRYRLHRGKKPPRVNP